MILTHLPDLPPRPQTAANAAFRRRFYERWGRENAIVCGWGKEAEFAAIPQTLSIKMALGGRERYFLPRREIVVDDDNVLVLNEGACYGSLLQTTWPGQSAWTFAVFFRPGMQTEIAAQCTRGLAAALADPAAVPRTVNFAEHLRPRKGPVSVMMMHIANAVRSGEREDTWLEEQLSALLALMLSQEHTATAAAAAAARPALRMELQRRLRLATDFIECSYMQPLTLEQMAQQACLSRYHFVRAFARLHGLTPHAYLTRKRALAARRLMASGELDGDQVAARCGFGSRWSLKRAIARYAR